MNQTISALSCFVACLLAGAGCANDRRPTVADHPEAAVVRISSVAPGTDNAAEGIGFLVSPDGLVATCSQLVSRDGSCIVTMNDGHVLRAMFVQNDPAGRIALLKIDGSKLPFFPLQRDEFLPGVHIRAVGPNGVVHAEFEQFENFGSDVGFTAGATVESGGPLIMDDGTVIGVVQGPAGNRTGVQLATPVWRIARMMPTKTPEQ